MQRIEEINGLERCFSCSAMDETMRLEARRSFEYYRGQGVILNERMEDPVWMLTDEKRRVRLSFDLNQDDCSSEMASWIGVSPEEFEEALRVYTLFRMGRFVLGTIQDDLRFCLSLGLTKYGDLRISPEKTSVVAEFLSILPGESLERDELLEKLDTAVPRQWTFHRRELASFSTYVSFEECLSQHWAVAEESEKVYLFPVYLWWTLTTILPLRPTEFLLIPRDCLRETQGVYYLTVRRTRLKKGQRRVWYRIDQDYERFTCEIPKAMAGSIQWYIRATENMPLSPFNTLLAPENHAAWLTYAAMNRRLKEVLTQWNLPSIHLGDTRHLSMISLILTGDTPSVCRALANHENVMTSAGYFSNMSSLTDCRVLHFLYNSVSSVSMTIPPGYTAVPTDSMLRMDRGFCSFYTVESFAHGNMEECWKTWTPDGGLGVCAACRHFIPDDPSVYLNMKRDTKNLLNLNWRWLMESIEALRKGNNCEETVDMMLKRFRYTAFQLLNIYEKETLYA